jgi:hypothetical protein
MCQTMSTEPNKLTLEEESSIARMERMLKRTQESAFLNNEAVTPDPESPHFSDVRYPGIGTFDPETKTFYVPDSVYDTETRAEIEDKLLADDQAKEENRPNNTYQDQLGSADGEERREVQLRARYGGTVEPSEHTKLRLEEERANKRLRESKSNKTSRHYDGSIRMSQRVGAYRRWNSDDSVDAHMRIDAALAGEPYQFEVCGSVFVGNAPFDMAKREYVDHISELVKELGLEPYKGLPQLVEGEIAPRRSRTTKRVPQSDILEMIVLRGCMTANELSDALYTEPSWTEEDRDYGVRKMRVALGVMLQKRMITRHKTMDGKTVFARRDFFDEGLSLRTTFRERLLAGEVSTNPAMELLTSEPPIEATAALMNFLKDQFSHFGVSWQDDVWRDVARDGVKKVLAGLIRGPEAGHESNNF